MDAWWHEVWVTLQAEFADIGDAAQLTRITVRLLIAALLGAILGFEREHKGKAAGVRTHMLVAGGAAGIAAAFNTPLAGIVFAIEELSGRFEHRFSGTLLTAVIVGGVVSLGLLGNYTYFGHVSARLPLGQGWLAILLLLPIGAFMEKGLTIKTGQTHVQRYLEPLMKKVLDGDIDGFLRASLMTRLKGSPTKVEDIE